ncbi:MAG: nucleotidyltransferase family protein [Candidatus Binatia bacterium]
MERFHPQKVILFGSYAYSQPTVDSDVDLLAVIDTEGPPLHVAAQIAAEIEHTFSRRSKSRNRSLANRGRSPDCYKSKVGTFMRLTSLKKKILWLHYGSYNPQGGY